jgi:hypothetical protein
MHAPERRVGRRKAGWRAATTSGLVILATIAFGGSAALATPLSRAATPGGPMAGGPSAGGPSAGEGTVAASSQPGPDPAVPHVAASPNPAAKGDLSTVWSAVLHGGYTSAGIGMRNLGYGTISITGVPAHAQVTSAFLLWDILANRPAAAFRRGTVNNQPVRGTKWASGMSPCWTVARNFSYEANVTGLVSGNGSYALAGFATGQSNGADPWNAGSRPPLLEGASLVVVYQLASMPQTVIQIDEGASETQSGASAIATLNGFAARAPASASTTYIVADGQEPGNTASFNGTVLPGIGFPGDAPQAVPDYSRGNLWDNVTANVSSHVTTGEKSVTVAVTGDDDCLAWVGQVLAVAGGATRVMVAMGDSYSSGEANPPFDAGTNVPNGDQCHRSPEAWPRLLAAADPTVSLEKLTACSGATTRDVTTTSFNTEPSQIAQLKALPQAPQVITITIGGDDLGFSSILENCFVSNCVLDHRLTTARNYIEKTLPGLLVRTYRAVHAAQPHAKIYVVGYPRLFPTQQSASVNCGWLSRTERIKLNGLGTLLNSVMGSAARQAGATYVPTLNAFAGHEECTANSWLYPIAVPPLTSDGHPLVPGQEALAAIVRRAIG